MAALPDGLNGDYLLTVTNSSSHLFGVFVITIGATGPAGPQGPQGPAGTGSKFDPQLVATLRWDQLPLAYGDFGVGASPIALAFDGANIWVANAVSNTVSKR